MLIASTAVFLYYTIWTLVMVLITYLALSSPSHLQPPSDPFLILPPNIVLQYTPILMKREQPFVDPSHPSQSLFLPRVWAIRLPVILILVGGAVVGSFLSLVMIRSNRKKALKAKAK